MPRPPRFAIADQPHHVVQRGNNRSPVFFVASDRALYLERLAEACARYICQVHAYVLMTNHVHLLMSGASAERISRTMQFVNSRYAQHINWRRERTGTLWEGRPRIGVVDSDEYFFACSRYVELNPVRAGLVSDPGSYLWSSYSANARARPDPIVRPHPLYESLGATWEERCAAYRAMFEAELDESTVEVIREATQKGWPIGRPAFRDAVGRAHGVRASPRPRGGFRARAGRPAQENQSALTRLIKK
jgi:putative transposase